MNTIKQVKKAWWRFYKVNTPANLQEMKEALDALPNDAIILTAAQGKELRKVLDALLSSPITHIRDVPPTVLRSLKEQLYGE